MRKLSNVCSPSWYCILEPVFPDLAEPRISAPYPGGDEEIQTSMSMSSTDRSTEALNAEGYLEPSPSEHAETHNFKGIKDM